MPEHVALLGDSIFDNAVYTQGQPDVISHLRELIPSDWFASLIAVDDSTTADLNAQVEGLPIDVTRAIVSIGGNDALLNSEILDLPVWSTQEALQLFSQRSRRFEKDYRTAIEHVMDRMPHCTVCTIYNGNLSDEQAPTARVALMLFNDVILRTAFQFGLDVIDLRLICVEPSDYANPIEPSGQGGRKIAQAIAASLGILKDTPSPTQIYCN